MLISLHSVLCKYVIVHNQTRNKSYKKEADEVKERSLDIGREE